MSPSPRFRSSFAASTGFVAAVTAPKARAASEAGAIVTRLPAVRVAASAPALARDDRAAA